jgi:hypothetical protein
MDWAIEDVDDTTEILEGEDTVIFPMDEVEARTITNEIRANLRKARDNVLEIYTRKGYEALGYESFQSWAKGEFEISWQQVYNLKAAAEYDAELSLYSPRGELYQIPVKHATQLRKLKTPELRVQAYQRAEQQARAQGKEAPTEEIVEQAVQTLKAEETVLESSYKVVRQSLAEGTLTASQAKQITVELDRLKDERAQAFVQKWMVDYGLSNPDLIYAIGHRFTFECKGGSRSKVLDEVEATKGRLARTPLSRATLHDWNRACQEAQAEHIAEGQEQKRLQMIAEGKPLPEQFALTLWKHDPAKTFQELVRRFDLEDLEDVFGLMAKQFGYAKKETEFFQTGANGRYTEVKFNRGEFDELNHFDLVEVFVRPKKEEKEKEGKVDASS